MRLLKRNKQTIFYSLLSGTSAKTDEYGLETGETTVVYSPVASVEAVVSAVTDGYAVPNEQGIPQHYARTLKVDKRIPIDETSRLWVGYGRVKEYSATRSYSAGDMAVYSGTLYRCTSATTGEWDATAWKPEPYNMAVERVAETLNFASYALREVKTS